MPSLSFTPAQAMTGMRLCHNITNMYQFIQLVRLDERTGNLIILVGEEIEIIVASNGQWRFER
jgi:hypothetical protein